MQSSEIYDSVSYVRVKMVPGKCDINIQLQIYINTVKKRKMLKKRQKKKSRDIKDKNKKQKTKKTCM